jgi:predicted ABC-type ATPase
MPELHIITGSNGAGKSSVGPEYLPLHIHQQGNIFDGDKLFMQKRSEFWNAGIKSHKECKKLAFEFVEKTFDDLVDAALASNANFSYEGHFTNEATWDIPRRFKAAGYEIHLIFFGLTDTTLSEMRVVDRSKDGGHYVDPKTVADNFYGNLEKLNKHYSMFDSVIIVDTSSAEHQLLAVFQQAEPMSAIASELLPEWFRVNLPAITDRIKQAELGSI